MEKLYTVILLISISISLRLVLQSFGQRWIMTTSHTSTLTILPIITYVITNVIAGNIALSLGMVGALSIVRFRNPVRSPLELTVYFSSITMGIAASVNIYWAIELFLFILLSIIILYVLSKLSREYLNIEFFSASFSEGNSLSTLELITEDEINEINKSVYLKSKQVERGQIKYLFVSSKQDVLKKLAQSVHDNNLLISYQLNL